MSRKIPIAKKTSKVWNFYTLKNETAMCNLCRRKISCKYVTNLRKHLLRKHASGKLKKDNQILAIQRHSKSRLLSKENQQRSSIVWNFFIKKGEMVECNICKQEFSFRVLSTSNLKKHLRRIHPTVELKKDNSFSLSQFSKVTLEGLSINHEHTTLKNTCSSVKPLNAKNIEPEMYISSWQIKNLNNKYVKNREKKAAVWNFFHLENEIAVCNLCKLKLSYRSCTPSNLKKHLFREHPNVKLPNNGISLNRCCKVTEKGSNLNSEQTSVEDTCLFDASLAMRNSEPGVSNSRGVINNSNNENMEGRKKTSAVWNFFNLVDKTAECDLCKSKMSYRSYSTSNLRKHLLRKHPNVKLPEENNNLGRYKRKIITENSSSNVNNTTSLSVNFLTDVSEVDVSSEFQTPESFPESIFNDQITKTLNKSQLSKDTSSSDIAEENLKNFVETPFVDVLSVDNYEKIKSCEPETSISILESYLSHRFKKNCNKTSILWNFFTLENETAICKLCEEKVFYRFWSLSNLKKHMLRKHPTVEISKHAATTMMATLSLTGGQDCGNRDLEDLNRNLQINGITEEHFNDNSVETPFILLIDNSENSVSNIKPVSSVFCSESTLDHKYQKKIIPSLELSENEDASEKNGNNFRTACGTSLQLLNEKDHDRDKKNGNKFSKVWSFYTIENEMAICKLCKRDFSCKWVSSLRHHLMRKHSNDSVPDDTNISASCTNVSDNSRSLVTTKHGVSGSSVALALTQGKRKPGKKTSIVWNYFTCEDYANTLLQNVTEKFKTAECNLCKRTFSFNSSLSNLKKHLIQKHAIGVLVGDAGVSVNCVSNTSEENSFSDVGQTQFMDTYFTNNFGSVITELLLHPALNVILHNLNKKKGNTFLENELSLSTKRTIDNLVLDLLIYDFQPFTLLEDVMFKKSMKILSPSYCLPSKKTFINMLLPARYEKCYNKLKKSLREKKILSVIFTLDCWTLGSDRCFLAVICSFINENLYLESKLLECFSFSESDTASNLAIKLEDIAKGWELKDKILLCISDNALNSKIAVKEILKWNHFECYTHVIKSIANDGLELHFNISSIIKKVESIVQYFKMNEDSMKLLLDLQEQLGDVPKELFSDVLVTWNSTFCMLERFVELEVPICSALALVDEVLPGLDSREWKIAAELIEVLRPLQEITEIINGENFMTASSVIVITKGMENAYKEMLDFSLLQETRELVETILLSIHSHLGDLESNDTLLITTFLDPRFKTVGFSNANTVERAKSLVINFLNSEMKLGESDLRPTENIASNNLIPSEKIPSTVWNQFDKRVMEFKSGGVCHFRANIEVQRYLEEPLLSRMEDPFRWWRENSQNFPLLKILFLKKFAALATNVSCEQLFSKTDTIPSDWRSRLSLEKVKELIFLFVNDQQERSKLSQEPVNCL